jgi:hypothetical protein
MKVAKPEPGRILTESDTGSSAATTLTVSSRVKRHISPPKSWTRSRTGASQRRSPADTCRCLPAVDLASVLARRAEREPELHLAGEADDLFDNQSIPQSSRVMSDVAGLTV